MSLDTEITPYALRVQAGFQKKKDLSAATGVHVRTIRKYERGDVQREDDLVFAAWEKLAKAIGCTPARYQLAVYNVKRALMLNAGKVAR